MSISMFVAVNFLSTKFWLSWWFIKFTEAWGEIDCLAGRLIKNEAIKEAKTKINNILYIFVDDRQKFGVSKWFYWCGH